MSALDRPYRRCLVAALIAARNRTSDPIDTPEAIANIACADDEELNERLFELKKDDPKAQADWDESQSLCLEEPYSAALLLVHAFAYGNASDGRSVQWNDLEQAYNQACEEIGKERVREIEREYAEELASGENRNEGDGQ